MAKSNLQLCQQPEWPDSIASNVEPQSAEADTRISADLLQPACESGLHIRNLSVRYQGAGQHSDTLALSQINLHIAKGEFVVAVGASGCGKTTLLNVIAGFTQASAGTLSLNGAAIDSASANRGVVFQKHALMPWLSVLDNVALGLRLRGLGKKQRHAIGHEKLEQVGLKDFAHASIWQLSGGMQQRVGIARALASDPDVLLLDEPLGALDAFTRESIQELLLRIWQETRKTIFFITHDVEEALFLASRLIVMSPRPGRIVQDQTLPFSQAYLQSDNARAIKSSAPFIEWRERVLGWVAPSVHAP
ncbi:ABC transporter ATP-binding protein [Lampropedia puyangensis]|uniref:ABC transporter ATP-binding protein n=1 Tax=Lampropedia puyangensis TaxID=1330072 RepID=A0A4S8F6T4_9BURK|nr:ABC transporter ATP-binding protein [Lampropedia puyangensis]THU01062.1 ABC transporter ATP-binding protein [Lampropedia puyangensis]